MYIRSDLRRDVLKSDLGGPRLDIVPVFSNFGQFWSYLDNDKITNDTNSKWLPCTSALCNWFSDTATGGIVLDLQGGL